MMRWRTLWWVGLLLPGSALADVDYTVKVDFPTQSIDVSIHVDHGQPEQLFRIPAWCPGFYFIEQYQGLQGRGHFRCGQALADHPAR